VDGEIPSSDLLRESLDQSNKRQENDHQHEDCSTWTCKKFVESGKDEIGMILTWLDGWYKGDEDGK
jgi:hypothetical protein